MSMPWQGLATNRLAFTASARMPVSTPWALLLYVSDQARSAPERQVRLVRRGGDEVLENVRHRRRRLGVREVLDTFEHLEATARQRVMSGVRVRHGNDPVAISPDQQGGYIGREVKLIQRTDGLTAVVHHRAQGPQERLAGRWIRQGGVRLPHLTDARGLDPGRGQPRTQLVAEVQYRLRCDYRKHELGTGRRQDPQQRTEVGAQTATGRSALGARSNPGVGTRTASRCRLQGTARSPSPGVPQA